ncbi:aminopeptidase N [Algoriphagus boseongensis]|uniref:Aminopeptidase N n=1 Tax=Algoriphagus boseongensis TaxID=1442587 RepID=A0A4R6T4A1_9BACT|nr:M1 family metallopeptidase [Algoriphagus boseongensis]TDQ14707.1 aminopeptidase N [Algoriphagus boseongensis]
MKQLPSTPKGNSTLNFKIATVFFLFLALLSCKSEKVSTQKEPSAQSVFNTEVSNEDSLERLKTLRAKESAIGNYRASAKRDFDLLHTDLELAFDWENQAVIGKAKLKLKPFFYPQKELILDAKDYDVGAVFFIKNDSTQKVNYGYNEKQLLIYLPQELTEKDTFGVEINYRAYPERNSGNGSEAISDTKGLYFIDPLDTIPGKPRMIWTQGETEHNSKWFPTIDKPNERATQLFKLTVPDSLVTVSNGVLVKSESLGDGLRKDYWEMTLPHAPYLAAIAVGDFGKAEDRFRDIPLGYYVEKGYEKGAAKVFANTPEMIGFFESKLGVNYPWPKYDQIVVRDFVSGAMENTTASIFMENLLLDEREAIDSEWDYIIAHELFHQWFGDFVTTESWSNLTLNEAFANYSEYLWNEYKYSKDEAALKLVSEMEGYFAEAETKQVNLIRFEYEDNEDMFDAHSYNKGGVILHMLRQKVGDEAFFKALNLYLNQNAFQSVEVHDLRLAFEKVTGEDLNWFFNQWFLDKGHPELIFDVDYSQPENILISVFQVQDPMQSPVFQFPLEVSWYEDGERKRKTFFVNESFQQFTLENKNPVSQVYLDEGKNLLARRTQEMSPSQYLRQLKESKLGVARYEALDSLISKGEEELLFEAIPFALQDSFWAVKENVLGFLQSDSSWGQKIEGIESGILKIAESDPKNSVRAAALDVFATWDADKYSPIFKKMVQEPSYLVAGSALAGLVQSGENALDDEEIVYFEKETNFRMIIPLAEYFLENEVAGKGNWFFEKVRSLNGEGLYFFLGYFGEYFSRMPDEGKENASAYLLNLMKNQTQNYIRLGSFQALMGFADDQEIVKKIQQVASEEKDLQLRNYYNYYLEALVDEN